jgi:hypothetical protein
MEPEVSSSLVPTRSQMNPVHNTQSCFSNIYFNIVAYLLKARNVEPETQPLQANGSEKNIRF